MSKLAPASLAIEPWTGTRVDDITEIAPFDFVDQTWAPSALCAQVDPETWFPAKGKCNGHAKRVCGRCPARAECLEWALLTNQRFGILGGLSTLERDTRRRTQGRAS